MGGSTPPSILAGSGRIGEPRHRGVDGGLALGKLTTPQFLPGSAAEWTGLFLFGVGTFGAYNHAVMRHWALWGVVPLDWYYLALLVIGSGLLLACSPLTPWNRTESARAWMDADNEQPGLMAFLRILRGIFALALMGAVIWVALTR